MWAQLIPLTAIAALVLVSVMQYLSYRYRIGNDALSIRSGIFERTRREIPFARIHYRNARVESPNSTFSLSSQTEPHGGAGSAQGPINRRCQA